MTQEDSQQKMRSLVEQMFGLTKDYLKQKSKLEKKPNSGDAIITIGMSLKFASDDLYDQLRPLIEQNPEAWEAYKKRAPARIRQTLPGFFP